MRNCLKRNRGRQVCGTARKETEEGKSAELPEKKPRKAMYAVLPEKKPKKSRCD